MRFRNLILGVTGKSNNVQGARLVLVCEFTIFLVKLLEL
jgi:hypothetical protein